MLRFVFHKIYVGFMPGYLKSNDKQISEIEIVCSDCSVFENISAHHKLLFGCFCEKKTSKYVDFSLEMVTKLYFVLWILAQYLVFTTTSGKK